LIEISQGFKTFELFKSLIRKKQFQPSIIPWKNLIKKIRFQNAILNLFKPMQAHVQRNYFTK
jgi:hypothetical protein